MPHVREQGVDFVVSAFIVHRADQKVLLVNHKKLGCWLPPGGHVGDDDPCEDTDAALCREVEEETGLVVGKTCRVWQPTRPWYFEPMKYVCPHNSRSLLRPWAVEIHDFPPVSGHKHLALVYLLTTEQREVLLEEVAHSEIRWFDRAELLSWPAEEILPSIRQYGNNAIRTTMYAYSEIGPTDFKLGG